MYILITVNQYLYVILRVSSVVAYWLLCVGLRDGIPVKSEPFYSCSRHIVILHYTKDCCTRVFYFSNIFTHTSLQVALVSIPPHKFVCPSCWYYLLQEIEKYDFRGDPNGITSIPNFTQIRPAVLELNRMDRQTDMTSSIIPCTWCKERIKMQIYPCLQTSRHEDVRRSMRRISAFVEVVGYVTSSFTYSIWHSCSDYLCSYPCTNFNDIWHPLRISSALIVLLFSFLYFFCTYFPLFCIYFTPRFFFHLLPKSSHYTNYYYWNLEP
jgi:hypothetical protein